jgi:hypothetical protein
MKKLLALLCAFSAMASPVLAASYAPLVLNAGKIQQAQSGDTVKLPNTAGGGTKCLHVDNTGAVTTASGDCGTGSGSVTTTGSPANGNLSKFSGASSITNGDLSGDATTSGTLTTTVAKINGTSVPASPSTHQVLVVTGSNTGSWKTVPDCQDSGGNHLNYTQSTDTISCGTSGGGGGGATFVSSAVIERSFGGL